MKISYLMPFFLVIQGLAVSCIKDKSNYDFDPHEEITVTGIESSYSRLSGVERIVLEPTITTSDEHAQLEYTWMLLPSDTIGTTKNLDYLITKAPGEYELRLQVKNLNTGYSHFSSSLIQVGTAYTRGWYVAKSLQNKTDVDLFLTPSSSVAQQRVDDVFSLNNERKLQGQPRIMTFYPRYYAWNGTNYGLSRSLFVVTENDLSAVDTDTFKEIRSFEDIFYVAPEVRDPAFVIDASFSFYTINDGQLYAYSNATSNNGQFGAPNVIDEQYTPYRLSKYFIGSPLANGGFFFDEISSSFVAGVSTGGYLARVKDAPSTDMSANNNNMKLIYMGLKNPSGNQIGYAIFQDITNPTIKYLSQITTSTANFMIKNKQITAVDKIYHADKYMVLDGDENMMFFTVGNEVWSRNLSNDSEQLQYTVPQGEQITMIRHKKYSMEGAFAHNYVAIGSVSNQAYKVRMFERASGRLAEAPRFTMEGTGDYVGDVIYVAPGLQSFFTHNPSY